MDYLHLSPVTYMLTIPIKFIQKWHKWMSAWKVLKETLMYHTHCHTHWLKIYHQHENPEERELCYQEKINTTVTTGEVNQQFPSQRVIKKVERKKIVFLPCFIGHDFHIGHVEMNMGTHVYSSLEKHMAYLSLIVAILCFVKHKITSLKFGFRKNHSIL